MKTGWTYTEIKNMSMDLKELYALFIDAQTKREQEHFDKFQKDLMGKVPSNVQTEHIKFIDEETFLNSLHRLDRNEKFINQ